MLRQYRTQINMCTINLLIKGTYDPTYSRADVTLDLDSMHLLFECSTKYDKFLFIFENKQLTHISHSTVSMSDYNCDFDKLFCSSRKDI